MFWRFGSGNLTSLSSLDALLDKPDVELEQVLDEPDLIQEVKAQSAKVIEYLRSETVLKQLLQYVVAPRSLEQQPLSSSPPDESKKTGGFFKPRTSKGRSKSRDANEAEAEKQEAQRTKFAYIACEILSSEVNSIYDALLEEPAALKEFWAFLGSDAPLDAVQAGYFTKINEAILEKKTEEMVGFIQTLDTVVSDMMKHVDCPMIMDLLLKLISLEKEPEGQGIVDWLQSQGLIPKLLAYIKSEHSPATQTSAGDFLKAIITISANATGQDASVIGPNELTRQLVSEPCVNALITEMLKGGNPLTVGVGIVIEVIRKNNSDYDAETQIGPEPKSSDPIYLGTLLRIFANHIPDFMSLILSPQHTVTTEKGSQTVERKEMKTAWGARIEPLGFDRFKTCELMAELLHCSNMGLLNEKGSDIMVKARDNERERLKAEGKLSSTPPLHAQNAFGTSVDSTDYHHTPLGGSPEEVKRLEVQNIGDDEEFEKVALSEAVPPHDLDQELDDLTEDFAEAGVAVEHPQRTSSLQDKVEKPAPLFATRKSSDDAVEAEPSQTNEKAKDITSEEDEASQKGASESPEVPVIETEDDGSPVVGDLLKMKFVENRVVPTILDFFFRFPWNNFLHNVVYDVVQQVFNGSMDRGFNRNLAIDLFQTGRITDRVIEGQQESDKAQKTKLMRLGYMGHLTLIAEEIVKFTERQPAELLAPIVVSKVTNAEWMNYVEHTLTETRDRDNAILGGVRPDAIGGPRQAVLNAVSAASGNLTLGASAALASAGLGGSNTTGLDTLDLGSAGTAGYGLGSGNLLSGFGSSDDEDEDELEEGELGGEGVLSQPQQSAVDDQAPQRGLGDFESDASAGPQSSNSSKSPGPLAIPPSRARRQLAVRLAEKQRLATSASGDSTIDEVDEGAVKGPGPLKVAGADPAVGKSTFGAESSDEEDSEEESDEKGQHSSEEETSHQDEDKEKLTSDESEPDSPIDPPNQRQTTRVASREERRPLDLGSDSDGDNNDDDEDEMGNKQSPGAQRLKLSLTADEEPLNMYEDLQNAEDYWRLGELRQAAKERAEAHKRIEEASIHNSIRGRGKALGQRDPRLQGQNRPPIGSGRAGLVRRVSGGPGGVGWTPATLADTEQGGDPEKTRSGSSMSAKQREQEALLEQWGLGSNAQGEDDADDDDDDEDVVEMGTKYLRRRSTGASSGSRK